MRSATLWRTALSGASVRIILRASSTPSLDRVCVGEGMLQIPDPGQRWTIWLRSWRMPLVEIRVSRKYLHHKRAEPSVNTTEHSSKGPSVLGTSLTYSSKQPDATFSGNLPV